MSRRKTNLTAPIDPVMTLIAKLQAIEPKEIVVYHRGADLTLVDMRVRSLARQLYDAGKVELGIRRLVRGVTDFEYLAIGRKVQAPRRYCFSRESMS